MAKAYINRNVVVGSGYLVSHSVKGAVDIMFDRSIGSYGSGMDLTVCRYYSHSLLFISWLAKAFYLRFMALHGDAKNW